MRPFSMGGVLLVCVTFIVMSCVIQGANTVHSNSEVFQNFPGIELQAPCTFAQPVVSSVLACAMRCKTFPSCRAASYNKVTARCCLSSLLAYEQGATYLENEDSIYFQPLTDTVKYDNWTLVFRMLAGSGQECYATWTSTGLYHDHWLGSKDMKLGCVSMNASKPCNTLFRSRLLDDWPNLKVKKVRVSLFKDSQQVNIVFNGSGSSYLNWFSQSRILESPWKNFFPNTSYIYFSVAGDTPAIRRFLIQANYGGCSNDRGWLVVVDGTKYPCTWDRHPAPAILYSGSQGAEIWQSSNSSVVLADVFAVFIQY